MPAAVKKIFWTTIAPSTPGNVAPAIRAVYMSSDTNVPMFAGRKAFSATPAAYAARIGPVRDLGLAVPGAQDEEPAEGRERGLDGLEGEPGDDVLDSRRP